MSKRSTLITLAIIATLVVGALIAAPRLLDNDRIKTRVEALASQSLHREIRIEGPLHIALAGGVRLTAHNVHIRDGEQELLDANRVNLHLAWLPLLTGKLKILSLHLEQPTITIVRRIFANPKPYSKTVEVLEIAEASVTGATLSYTNPLAQSSLFATACDAQLQQIRLIQGPIAQILQDLAFTATLECGAFEQSNYQGTDLVLSAVAEHGVIKMAPVTMQFLGGRGIGNVEADLSGPSRQYHIHYVLPGLNLEGLLPTLPPAFAAAGALDLTLNLALQGNNSTELTRSATGTIFLHGSDLTLTGIDLDRKFAQFEDSQNFNLIDAGAFFFAGPLGLLATKGYDFTSLLQQTGGSSAIPALISDWVITDGVMQAVDVAMATRQNRVALQGRLDLGNKRFDDVTMALIDREGCSVVQQVVGGSFAEPEAEQPFVLTTLAGPVLKILELGVSLFTDNTCEAFYTGSVQAPR